MNSCRVGLQVWPTAVRNSMPATHSASVRSTSRAKPCRCRTRLVMTVFRRRVVVFAWRAVTAPLIVVWSRFRMRGLLCLPCRKRMRGGSKRMLLMTRMEIYDDNENGIFIGQKNSMSHWTEYEFFVRVVELGSLSKAAEAMGLSNPSASRHLAALERRLGARLIERSTRRLFVTDVGQDFYRCCKRTPDHNQKALQPLN